MATVVQIKVDLPHWPDDVIDIWLAPLSNRTDTGWPPPEPMRGHSWYYILGEKPLAWWRQVTWELKDVDCSFEKLSLNSRKIVNQMLAEHIDGKGPFFGGVDPSSKRRFLSAVAFVAKNGKFPRPLLGMQVPSGLSILDGNHRIAAHAMLRATPDNQFEKFNVDRPSAEQAVWVGSHTDGETPDAARKGD